MDKNTIIGFVLIAGILIGYSFWTRPSAEEMAEIARQDSIAQVEQKKQAERLKNQQLELQKASEEDTTQLFYAALRGESQQVVLKNSKLELTLNSKGGTVSKVVIKDFEDINNNKDITLFEGNNHSLNFILATKEANINTSDLFFMPSDITDSTVTMVAQADAGKSIELKYTLHQDYLLHLQLLVNGMQGAFQPNTNSIDINWFEKCQQQEKGFTFENRYATLTYHLLDGGTDYLNESKEKIDENIEEKTDWVAFKNQFFSAVMIAKTHFNGNALFTSIPQEKGSGYLKQYEAKMKTSFDPNGKTPTELEFYYGPNDFRLLQKVEEGSKFKKDLELQRLVYLGWPLFRIINRWFTIYVFDFLTSLNINMGIVLILITLLLKLITFPLVKKSYMGSAKMRVLKPKLEEATAHLNKPEDQMQKQQVMMQEYAKYGASPLSGCLPMLIQMPIWIAMFNFVPNAIQLRRESFLWIKDLSTYDPIYEWGKSLPLISDHLSLTCILFCVANILAQITSLFVSLYFLIRFSK